MEQAGRNDPCPCGSGLKYKKCCYGKPSKRKFSAKVVKAGGQAPILPEVLKHATEADRLKAEPFKMTDRDFRKT